MSSEPTVVSEQLLAELARERAEARAEAEAEPKVAVARVDDVDAGGVPARLYVPGGAPGAVLYLHGGGFAMGDLVTHDGFARRLADRTGWAVLMPDYRRSPEHAWPAAADDAAAASDWLAGQGFARLAVVGDSAGSALAIGEALRHPDRWVAQVQVYPFVDPSCASYDTSWWSRTCRSSAAGCTGTSTCRVPTATRRCTSWNVTAWPGSRRHWCSWPRSTC